jgi:O-methyltransferase
MQFNKFISKIYFKLIMLFCLPLFLSDYFLKGTGAEYGVSFLDKLFLFFKIKSNNKRIVSTSSTLEHLKMAVAIFQVPKINEGVVVECGSYKGASSANLSLICQLCGRKLEIFDSFEGLPGPLEDDKGHLLINSKEIHSYQKGSFRGSLEEVKENIKKFGSIESCKFNKGYFNKTLPNLKEKCIFVFEDADLKKSVEDCLVNIWPLLQNGCCFYTHEAQHMKIASLFFDQQWWKENLKCDAPGLVGAGNGLGIGINGSFFGGTLAYTVKNPKITEFKEKIQG